jgi:hypothetical protein
MRFRGQRDSERPPPAEVYLGLRQQMLSLTAAQLADDELADTPIPALLMVTGYPEAVATLVAVVDGTSSLYFSNGGGLLGAGTHETVAEASLRWLETGREFLPKLSGITEARHPIGRGRLAHPLLLRGGPGDAERRLVKAAGQVRARLPSAFNT